ncbi:MAG TPA: MFS transporter [Xanthobacteraceae bacterium]|nr:MFS transporter [Xanthobacteraceae bacterium]
MPHEEHRDIAAERPPKASRSNLATSLTLVAMSLGYGVVQLDVTVVNTALSTIGASLGGGVSELQWVVSTYTIAFAALIMTAGALGDRFGAKRVFVAGFAIFTCASLVCALAPTAAILVAGRAIQGIGAAALVPNSLALLNHTYPGETERGRAVGIWAAGASLALTAGPLAGGALIAIVGWRSIFLVNLPIGLVGLWLTWRYAEEVPRSQTRELDVPGQMAAIAALGVLAGALIEGGRAGWGNPGILAAIVMSAVLATLFVLQERRTAQPMLPLALFRHHRFTLASLVGLLVNIAFYGLIFVLSLYFQQINDLSPLATGLAFVPMMGVVLPLNLLAPRAAEVFGAPVVVAAGAALAAAGCVALLGIGPGTRYWAVCAQLVAIGGGLGLLVPPLTSMLLGSVEKARSGIAAGVFNSTRQTGSVLGVALFGSLIGRSGAFMTGARESLVISAALLLGASVAMAFSQTERSHND